MKTIILVRHAKSSHDFGAGSDFNRPLNERGFRDAAEMGKKLLKKEVTIDHFVSSPALRAKRTAELFASVYNYNKNKIEFIPYLYHAGPENFSSAITSFNDAFDSIAIFSHNPGITEFADSLTHSNISNMPTSSVFAVTVPIDSWKDFETAEKNFSFYLEIGRD